MSSEPESGFGEEILESAHGANMIVIPCPVCQMNTEIYQDTINGK